jgi:hypothetical protein
MSERQAAAPRSMEGRGSRTEPQPSGSTASCALVLVPREASGRVGHVWGGTPARCLLSQKQGGETTFEWAGPCLRPFCLAVWAELHGPAEHWPLRACAPKGGKAVSVGHLQRQDPAAGCPPAVQEMASTTSASARRIACGGARAFGSVMAATCDRQAPCGAHTQRVTGRVPRNDQKPLTPTRVGLHGKLQNRQTGGPIFFVLFSTVFFFFFQINVFFSLTNQKSALVASYYVANFTVNIG